MGLALADLREGLHFPEPLINFLLYIIIIIIVIIVVVVVVVVVLMMMVTMMMIVIIVNCNYYCYYNQTGRPTW